MARKNERDRTSARTTSSGARGAAGKGGTARGKAAAGGSRKAGGVRKTGGGRKTARKAAGERKGASRRGAGGRKSEAREMAQARTSRRAGPKKPLAAGRGRGAGSTRRAGARGAAPGGRTPIAQGRNGGVGKGTYSDSARRALWIDSPEQHAGRPGQTLATRDHDVIRQWAEERGAVPATISGTEHDGRPGVLRFDFPAFAKSGGRLRQVDWDEWFETFDARNLVFLFQEQMKSGRQSNFFRLDSPEREG